ncbi:hypothetical protein AB7Y92_15090 [Providencia manganoxydans]|uniref:phage tail fiber protein n=1 Tax=Providencia manganoxydans TaxID=2923283 RepID=UPI0034E39925
MYNIGTVTATANSTKLVGIGTKWKENINLVLPMQSLQIQIGNTVHNNSIHSIQSNTELTLNFPLPASQTGAKYVIFTTTMDSISAAANAIVAMNVSNVQFSDIQNRIMTESGVIDIKLPDGTVRKTRTEAERDKLLDGKFDKTGGVIKGSLQVTESLITSLVQAYLDEVYVQLNVANGEPRIHSKRKASGWKSHTLPDANGTLMQVGDYGWGGTGGSTEGEPAFPAHDEAGISAYIRDRSTVTSVFRSKKFSSALNYIYSAIAYFKTGNTYTAITANHSGAGVRVIGGYDAADFTYNLWTDRNTTKDSNGNLKAASPIVKVFADHIELNEESEGVELEKLGTGRYKLKGVLGMNSDASWGGIHGGMVIPNGINNLPLVWGSFDVLPDGDIIIETRYRKHELNERQEAERLMTYPEFLKDELVEVDTEEGKKEKLLKVEREDYEYCDIPNGHWIDVRVNMPSNSIYNLKQAEAERLAKEAAEKQAEEEAKLVAEEAERAEQGSY